VLADKVLRQKKPELTPDLPGYGGLWTAQWPFGATVHSWGWWARAKSDVREPMSSWGTWQTLLDVSLKSFHPRAVMTCVGPGNSLPHLSHPTAPAPPSEHPAHTRWWQPPDLHTWTPVSSPGRSLYHKFDTQPIVPPLGSFPPARSKCAGLHIYPPHLVMPCLLPGLLLHWPRAQLHQIPHRPGSGVLCRCLNHTLEMPWEEQT
jgi:hypothetical protein